MRGFAVPILLFVVALLAVVFLTFSSSSEPDIKGIASTNTADQPGFVVSVISESPTWNLVGYLCKNLSSCQSSLNEGKRIKTISGGATELKEIEINYSDVWESYDFVKIYVVPGLAGDLTSFKILSLGDMPGSVKEEIDNTEVLLMPVGGMSSGFFKAATFNDR